MLQVLNQRVEHGIEGCRCHCGLLGIVEIGHRGVRHITERTDEIKITEVAQSRHFCSGSIQFALRVIGVFLCHGGRIVQHNIACVDHIINFIPRREPVAGIDILLEDIGQVLIVGHVGPSNDIVRAELSPCHHALNTALRLKGAVTTGHHIVNVALLIPKLFKHDLVQWLHFKEVGTRRKHGHRDSRQPEFI